MKDKTHKSSDSTVLLVFVDGLGIGLPEESNPFWVLNGLNPLAHISGERTDVEFDGIMVETDACLGVEGRPQSASGQTTIYTGVNAPESLGYHKQGFPNAELRALILEHSIFKQIDAQEAGPAVFANTYTPSFFEKTPRWKSATTCAVEAAGLRFCRLPDLLGNRSLYHDFTNRILIESGFDVPEFSTHQAAQILASLSQEYRFVLYEHFITDKIGHDRDWDRARNHLPELAAFVRATLNEVDLATTTVILTSDHGNIEDLSIRNHTLNKVPTIVWGREKRRFAERIASLADITPSILDLLT